jgi:eukaryotic-like serine/threonine-protein kinase
MDPRPGRTLGHCGPLLPTPMRLPVPPIHAFALTVDPASDDAGGVFVGGGAHMAHGSEIGAYRVLETLGRGGMGVVYRARHVTSDKIVALKTVRLQAPSMLECIRREIHALTRIHHPGVVRILDDGVHEGRPWYAMELLEGETLRNYIQRIWSPYRRPSIPVGLTEEVSMTEPVSSRRPIISRGISRGDEGPTVRAPLDASAPAAAGELKATLRIFRRVCATLAFLHGEGFINCDLKPENILLVNLDPILIDFGLIARNAPRESLEYGRVTAGTLPYMSPEQIRGEYVDARADLYSLGCMLYELLVGTPPFTGTPAHIKSQHLSSDPAPPSTRVTNLPIELDGIIRKLIEKDLPRRSGFADEVAASLSDLCDEEPLLRDFPPAKPYLYRPRFVGRDEVIAKLVDARDRAAAGSGSFVLLRGESGVGKTRVAMEMTRLTPTWPIQVLTSEVAPVAIEGATSVAPAPLQALRPLLRAVADRCQVGGPEMTERLLGPARSVLAKYEPLLAEVPAYDPPAPPIPLSPEASRRHLFECLASTLAAVAAELPLLWVLDDVGWADELSLAFLESLTPAFFRRTAILILCMHRSEEVSDRLDSIIRMPHVEQLRLSRLSKGAVGSIVGDMLALREPAPALVEFVGAEADGNPFFVAEYLRAVVSERLLHRDANHTWQLSAGSTSERQGLPGFESLGVPGSLRALIEQRLRRLSVGGLRAGIAAAVLGRETDTSTLREVAGFDEEAAIGPLDELLRREVLELSDSGTVRFAHDKLREIAYALADPRQRLELHGRAARAIESRVGERPEAKRFWSTLGHHFAAAELHGPAARYLKLAADQARSTYANEEAIRLYREVIHQVSADRGSAVRDERDGVQLEVNEGLADVLALTGKRDEARASYASALARASRSTTKARLHRKTGKTWEVEHRHDAALAQYGQARAALGADLTAVAPEERDEGIQAHIEELWVYYWLARVEDMDSIAENIEPFIVQHGSNAQKSRFFQTRALAHMRRDRYVIREATLGFARSGVEACRESGHLAELPMAHFVYGFALLLAFSLENAAEELSVAEAIARKSGDAGQLARSLAYLAVTARLRGRVADAARYAAECAKVARDADIREYYAAAIAIQAWIALRDEPPGRSEPLAREALAIWASLKLVFPFQSLALVPLMRIAVARGDMNEAMRCARAIMDPSQQMLPGPVAAVLAQAETSWASGRIDAAEGALRAALEHLDPDPGATLNALGSGT